MKRLIVPLCLFPLFPTLLIVPGCSGKSNTTGQKRIAGIVFQEDQFFRLVVFLLSDDNVLQAVTGQRPYENGSMAVESALKVLRSARRSGSADPARGACQPP